jgi:hypothetical protein
MRVLTRIGFIVASLVLWLAITSQPAAACEGGNASLAVGINGATSIYYARILAAHASDVGFYVLRLDVGQVVRGPAPSEVSHLITPRACDELSVGQYGIVVLGSVNPFGVGPTDIYNFFYVLGPGHTSAAGAAQVLSALPATDALPRLGPATPEGGSPMLPLVAGAVAGVAVLGSRRDARSPAAASR